MNPRHALKFVTAMCALIVACTDSTLLHTYQPTTDEGWKRGDTLHFQLPEVKADGVYAVDFGMRYRNDFPYQGIWVVAETHLHQPSRLQRDTLYFAMSDEEGRSLGNGIDIQQLEAPFFSLHLKQGQSGTIHLRHIMTREVVPAVSDVGLKIAKAIQETHKNCNGSTDCE